MAFTLDIGTNRRISIALGRIERFRAGWGGDFAVEPDLLHRMEESGRIASTGALCRLAGLRVDDRTVEAVLESRDHGLPPPTVREIRGCHAALAAPLPPAERLVRAEDLAAVNAALAGRPTRETRFRSADLMREAFDADGHATGRVFPGLAPRLLGTTVDDLITWLEYELRDRKRNEVLVVAGFTLGLLAASPFARRNGRTALVLLDGLLRRSGHRWLTAGSLLAEIERRRDEYHGAFDASRIRVWAGDADMGPWTELIVDAVDRVRERVAARVELEDGASSFPPLQRAILDEVSRHGTVDAGLLLEATGANRNTLKDNLRRLVERGVLERSGQRRGTRYRLRTLD